MSAPDTVVAVTGLVKNYQALRPLRIAELQVRRGERVAIAGIDAIGAELIVNLLNGATLPEAGEIRVFGRATKDIENEAQWLASLERFGIVTRRAVLLDGATGAQNLALPTTLEIDPVPADVRRAVDALAAEVGLAQEWLDLPVAKAPETARMRMQLARAIAIDPELLLMEHPTIDLPREDVPDFARSVRQVAERRGLTLVVFSFDAEFSAVVADRTLKLQPASGELVDARSWWTRLTSR